jgi:hypothetical protein
MITDQEGKPPARWLATAVAAVGGSRDLSGVMDLPGNVLEWWKTDTHCTLAIQDDWPILKLHRVIEVEDYWDTKWPHQPVSLLRSSRPRED